MGVQLHEQFLTQEARSSPADDSPRAPACLVITPGTASTARVLPLQVPGRRASRDAGAGRRRACPRGAGSRGHALREAPGGLVISAGALAARLGRGGRRAERPAAQQVARGCSARAVARGARRGALFRRGSAGSACRRGCCAWQQPLRGGRRRPRSQRGGGDAYCQAEPPALPRPPSPGARLVRAALVARHGDRSPLAGFEGDGYGDAWAGRYAWCVS